VTAVATGFRSPAAVVVERGLLAEPVIRSVVDGIRSGH
jgi:hypothetical protein